MEEDPQDKTKNLAGDVRAKELESARPGSSSSSQKTQTNNQSVGSDSGAVALKEREDQATGGFYKSEATGSAEQSNFYVGSSNKSGSGKRDNRLVSFTKSNLFKKSSIAILGVGGLGALGLIAAISILFGSLKIPQFGEHMLEYQFARVSRQFSQANDAVTSEKLALDAQDAAVQASLDKKFNVPGSELYDKFKGWLPSGVIENLKSSSILSYNYAPSTLGFKQLKSITLNNETVDLTPLTDSTFTKVLHFQQYFNPIKNFQTKVQIANSVSTGLNVSLRDNTGVIIRGVVENRIRSELGIGLIAWVVGKYQGKSADDALLQQQRDAYSEIDNATAEASIDTPIENAIKQGQATEQADVQNNTQLTTIDNNAGIDPNVDNSVQSALNISDSTFSKVVGVFNPFYQIALPICIIYDGSLNSSSAQQTIDAQTSEDQKAFYLVESASDQQKAGNTTPEAVGALSKKIGDITQSNVELRANGSPVDTSRTNISPEEGPGGSYSILNAIPGLSSVAGIANKIATNVCPAMTNIWFALGTGVLNIVGQAIADVFSGGGASAAEEGSAEAAATTIGDYLSGFASNIASRFSVDKTSTSGLGRLIAYPRKVLDVFGVNKQGLLQVGKIAGLTEIARLITFSKMNNINNGLAMNSDFDNQSEAGGNINANEVSRREFYGVPLTNAQTTASNALDANYRAEVNSQKSFVDRYFSFSNPDSLVSTLGLKFSSTFNRSFLSDVFGKVENMFNPVLLAKSLGDIFTAYSFAATDNSDYGNVQWGFPDNETNLINTDPSYQPLENEQILLASGKQDYVSSTYGKCYTDTIGTLLTGSDNGGSPEITRDDSTGDITGGMCREQNLGPDSSDANTYYSYQGKQSRDLVFRWRLEQYYNNTLDQLTGLSNATK